MELVHESRSVTTHNAFSPFAFEHEPNPVIFASYICAPTALELGVHEQGLPLGFSTGGPLSTGPSRAGYQSLTTASKLDVDEDCHSLQRSLQRFHTDIIYEAVGFDLDDYAAVVDSNVNDVRAFDLGYCSSEPPVSWPPNGLVNDPVEVNCLVMKRSRNSDRSCDSGYVEEESSNEEYCQAEPVPLFFQNDVSSDVESRSKIPESTQRCPSLSTAIEQKTDHTRHVVDVGSSTPASQSTMPWAPASSITPSRDGSESASTETTPRMLVLELLEMCQEQDDQQDERFQFHHPSFTDISTLQSSKSPSQATDGSGTGSTSTDTTTSKDSRGFSNPKRPRQLDRRERTDEGNGEEDEDNEHPRKRPDKGPDAPRTDGPASPPNTIQIPCPLSESEGCQGTNPSISELLRSLQNKHRTVFCSVCCTFLEVPSNEKKPEIQLKDHELKGCERRCIGQSCGPNLEATEAYHLRTTKCPSWKALTKELRWRFIWSLLNDGRAAPSVQFAPGIGFEHSPERRPSAQRSRARGAEVCRDLLRKLETKERRMNELENDLRSAKHCAEQLQGRFDDKIGELENIIEAILERLTEKSVTIPRHLQKRMQHACPKVMMEVLSYARPANLPPTPESVPNNGHSLFPGMPEIGTSHGNRILWKQPAPGQQNFGLEQLAQNSFSLQSSGMDSQYFQQNPGSFGAEMWPEAILQHESIASGDSAFSAEMSKSYAHGGG
jgi:hypothetical protein